MMKKNREPGLFRQIVMIHYEQAKRRKALRLLEKQVWSVDFLTELLIRAANKSRQNLEMVIENSNKQKIYIKAKPGTVTGFSDADDIFNHLDDDAAIQAFFREHSR